MIAVEAGHRYELTGVGGDIQTLQFIQKEEWDGELVTVIDGTTNEEVIAVLIDRIKHLNEKLPSEHNEEAVKHLEAALAALEARTTDRTDREVEGTPAE